MVLRHSGRYFGGRSIQQHKVLSGLIDVCAPPSLPLQSPPACLSEARIERESSVWTQNFRMMEPCLLLLDLRKEPKRPISPAAKAADLRIPWWIEDFCVGSIFPR